MSNSYTLLESRTEIENLGDLQGLIGTGLRHETTDVNRMINVSEQSLRSMLASNGFGHFLESLAPANLLTTPTVAGEEYVQVDWPSDAEGDADAVHAIHVKGGGYSNTWVQIEAIDWAQRRFYSTGNQLVWALKNLPRTQAGVKVAGKIQIMPVPKGGQVVIDYIPCWKFLTSDADVFVGLPDWHRWRHYDVLVSLLGLRDNDAQGTAQWAANERGMCEARIKEAAPKVRRSPSAGKPIRAPRGR